MKTFDYAPASPIKDNITMLAVSVGMVVVPLVYPFGIRIGSTRILGPTGTAIVFIIGGLVLLAMTLNKIRLARALAANGGKIVVDADSVTYPIIKKGAKTDKTGSSRKHGAWILRKVLNLWHENRRCNMDVPARGHGRAI